MKGRDEYGRAVGVAAGFFIVVLAGSPVSVPVGGAFGALVAAISPEVVAGRFRRQTAQGVVRYARAVGMFWTLFLGAAACGVACI